MQEGQPWGSETFCESRGLRLLDHNAQGQGQSEYFEGFERERKRPVCAAQGH